MALMAAASVGNSTGHMQHHYKDYKAFWKGLKHKFPYLLFCNTVSIQACVKKQEHESIHWEK